MSSPPVITAVGLVTPLGANLTETWDALCRGQAIRGHARAAGSGGSSGRFFDMAAAAAREAVAAAGWDGRRGAIDAALVVGTSKGPVESWLPPAGQIPADAYDAVGGTEGGLASRAHLSPRSFGLSDAARGLADRLPVAGPRLTVSAACASGLHALIRAALMIRGGEARRVLVVAAEASVHPLFVGSFQRLGVLAPEGTGCRPFDVGRAGFLMSEAAAAVCLEAQTVVVQAFQPAQKEFVQAGKPALQRILLDRYALGGDATHLTATDPDARTLRYLLARVVDGRPVDLVHAHGTGTEMNDPAELAAIESALAAAAPAGGALAATAGRPQPHLYSHKGALGHSLGAAGLVSVVLNWTAHRTGVVPPNVQTRQPLPASGVWIERGLVRRPVRRSVAVAAGFGGPTAVVSLASADFPDAAPGIGYNVR